jgi:hypothetical protein
MTGEGRAQTPEDKGRVKGEEYAMIDRRQLLTVGGLIGALVPEGEATASEMGQMSDRQASDLVSALKNISSAVGLVAAQQSFDPILPVRARQVDYLKANGKFPDFIDVSPDVWMAAYDWHVRLQQPLTIGRDAAGRYTLLLGFSTLVLRPDVAANFISAPYDNR